MSCGYLALKEANVPFSRYYAAEIDTYATKISSQNNITQLGDVTKWKTWDIDWASIDLLIGGSPCQGFSYIGKQLSFDDPRSALFFVYVDILNHIKSLNPSVKFMLENVVMKKEWQNIISESLGVQPIEINSLCVLPHSRARLYWLNWEAGAPPQQSYPKIFDSPIAVRRHGVWAKRETATCLDANYSKGADNHGQRTMQFKDGKWVKLTPEQCEMLQGVPSGYTAGVSNSQRYKMLGNGWTVPVVAHLFKELLAKS